jgi:hypothetical protein
MRRLVGHRQVEFPVLVEIARCDPARTRTGRVVLVRLEGAIAFSRRMETVLSMVLAVARSSLPSPVKSVANILKPAASRQHNPPERRECRLRSPKTHRHNPDYSSERSS